jgi:hypothetical protein
MDSILLVLVGLEEEKDGEGEYDRIFSIILIFFYFKNFDVWKAEIKWTMKSK